MKQGINCAMHSYLNNLMYTHTCVYIHKKKTYALTPICEWKLSINRDRSTQEKPSEHIPSVNQATKKPHMEGSSSSEPQPLACPGEGWPALLFHHQLKLQSPPRISWLLLLSCLYLPRTTSVFLLGHLFTELILMNAALRPNRCSINIWWINQNLQRGVLFICWDV